jgi:hypothetical protein
MSDTYIELIAVQPYMQLADYREVDTFRAKIAALTERIAAARTRRRRRADHPCRGTEQGARPHK